MNRSPLISIIIPVYKVEEYIERCMLSVLNQSYNNIEVLLIDDASPDNSDKVIESFIREKSLSNFKLIKHQENKGLSVARNTGINNSKGEYLYFLDSDDEIFSNTISDLLAISLQFQSEITVGETTCINESENWERNYFPLKNKTDNYIGNSFIFTSFIEGDWPVMSCDKLILKKFILDNNLFFTPDLFSQDSLWSYQCALVLENIAFLKQKTYKYYFHSNSIIHNRNKRNFDNWFTILKITESTLKDNLAKKEQILSYIIDYKATTLLMNWKAQKNETLWKESYNNYKTIASLSILDYFSPKYSLDTKKKDFLMSLPTSIGCKIFKKRFGA